MPKTMWPVQSYGLPRPRIMRGGRRLLPRPRGVGQTQDLQTSINELEYGPQALPDDALPIDMVPRIIQEYNRNPDGSISAAGVDQSALEAYLSRIADDTDMITSTIVLNQGLLGRTVTITTTPTLIINAQFLRGYIILNPNTVAGATSAGTLLASSTQVNGASGNSADLGVANFLGAHYFVDVSAVTAPAVLTVTLQALDPASGNWANVQDLVTTTNTVATTYAFVDALGTATDARLHWAVTGGGGDVTFSAGFVLKNGLLGTSSGISQTIYLGGPGVSTVSGFPLLNGQKEKFFLRENVQLWAVAAATLPLKIFEL